MTNFKLWFGSIIVIILLGLYAYSLSTAIGLAYWGPNTVEILPEGISRTMATVGGLVSALVIAQLAVTKPGNPLRQRPNASSSHWDKISEWAVFVTKVVYVLVWILLGFAAFVVGELWFPNKVPALTTFAQAWLGLAVAAGYAYFGLEK